MSYYAFAKQIKKSMLNYITFSKLTEVLLKPHPGKELNYRILRTVCFHYIQRQLVSAILTSRKLQPQTKAIHLRTRRQLLRFFIHCDS